MCTLIRESENIAEAHSPSCVYVGEFYLGRAQMKIWLKNKCHANQFMNLCSPKVNYLQACEQPPLIGYFFLHRSVCRQEKRRRIHLYKFIFCQNYSALLIMHRSSALFLLCDIQISETTKNEIEVGP